MNGGPAYRRVSLGGFGLSGRPPIDLLAIVVTLFVTWSLQFFSSTALVPAILRLSPLVWRGWVWQLVTYPFSGYGGASIWFLIELLILYWFGQDAWHGLGRKHFWRLVLSAAVAAGVVALVVALIDPDSLAAAAQTGPFPLLQGQRALMAILIAAYATANQRATIYLFFVLPVEARYFLAIEILFAFVGFLQTHDLGGFLGICVAVGVAYMYVRLGGRFGRGLRQGRLRLEHWWLQKKLERLKRRRNLRVIKGEGNRGPWVQ